MNSKKNNSKSEFKVLELKFIFQIFHRFKLVSARNATFLWFQKFSAKSAKFYKLQAFYVVGSLYLNGKNELKFYLNSGL